MKYARTRGVSTLAIIGVLLAATLAYTGWRSYQKNQARAAHAAAVTTAIANMDRARSQWVDAMRLATNTPRIGLAGPIASLQSLRQNTQSIPAPECLSQNKSHLLIGMNEAIEGMLAFMSNDMGKSELAEFTAKKADAMSLNFAEYAKIPVPCPQKK